MNNLINDCIKYLNQASEEYILIKKDTNLVIDEDKIVFIINKNFNLNITIKKNVSAKIIALNNFDKDINENITVEDNASLEYIKLQNFEKVIINTNTFLNNSSYINIMNLSINNNESVIKNITNLKEKNSTINEYNLYIAKSDLNITNTTNHIEKKTTSKMTNLVIAKNNSKSKIITNGKIYKDAKLSNVSQKTKGILTNNQTQIEADPLLRIDEFDCYASHGASVGCLNEEEIYYLMSRGLTLDESKNLIINGFINPIFTNLNLSEDLNNIIIKSINKII